MFEWQSAHGQRHLLRSEGGTDHQRPNLDFGRRPQSGSQEIRLYSPVRYAQPEKNELKTLGIADREEIGNALCNLKRWFDLWRDLDF
jgi:hypothetical protein